MELVYPLGLNLDEPHNELGEKSPQESYRGSSRMSGDGLQAPPTEFTSAFRQLNVDVIFHSEILNKDFGSIFQQTTCFLQYTE